MAVFIMSHVEDIQSLHHHSVLNFEASDDSGISSNSRAFAIGLLVARGFIDGVDTDIQVNRGPCEIRLAPIIMVTN